jgi:hypothetical protein
MRVVVADVEGTTEVIDGAQVEQQWDEQFPDEPYDPDYVVGITNDNEPFMFLTRDEARIIGFAILRGAGVNL